MRMSDWSSDVCSSDLASDVAAYVRELAGIDPSAEETRAMATIERYLVSIGWAYRMAGLDDPTAAPLGRLEKKAARKTLGVRQRQARAISKEERRAGQGGVMTGEFRWGPAT